MLPELLLSTPWGDSHMINQVSLPALLIGCALIAACGGSGGGGPGNTPPPPPTPAPPPPPPPSNSQLGDLRYDQTFNSEGASGTIKFDTGSSTVIEGDSRKASVEVRFDADSKSYTVETRGRSQTFAPTDVVATSDPGVTVFRKTDGTTSDYLTLVNTPYTASVPNRYVAQAFWQRNTIASGVQSTSLDSFVYGFETPHSAIPRTGTAGFVTDAFGLVTVPGKTPKTFVGSGVFNVDFGLGVFRTSSSVVEYDLITGAQASGGGVEYVGTGYLASGGGFSGSFVYDGSDTLVTGSIAGDFYGPNYEEVGASFSADNSEGAAVSGSLTGVRSGAVPAVNLSLANLQTEQLFYTHQSLLTVGANPMSNGMVPVNLSSGIGQFTLRPDGSLLLTAHTSALPSILLSATDQVAGRAGFVTYEKQVNGAPVRVELYRPDGGSALALTYAGFGSWSGGTAFGYAPHGARFFFTYGIVTPMEILSRRTGSATYQGVVYGAGSRMDGFTYDVGGSSQFNVNFGAQSFSGSLTLTGTPTSGGASTSFGTWTFADKMFGGQLVQTSLNGSGSMNCCNQIIPTFYGPSGEEIGATFSIMAGSQDDPATLAIAGATVAKRQ